MQSRAPLAQAFERTDGASRFLVVVVHAKSKDCSGATGSDADQGDGQGCYAARRVEQAQDLLRFVRTVSSAAGTGEVLIAGDFNAYAHEDPLRRLEDAGWRDVVLDRDAGAYTYVYDGASGALDHLLASPALADRVTGAGAWHLNADEPEFLDYRRQVPPPVCTTCTRPADAASPWRASDHDPILLGLKWQIPGSS